MKLLDHALRAVFPHVCEFCGVREAGPAESFICSECRKARLAIKWIVPPYCKKCGYEFEGSITNDFQCQYCIEHDFAFASARAAVHLFGLIKEVVHRFKYERNRWFEPFLAELLIETALPDLKSNPVDLMIPIPLHKRRRRLRGFNQAECLVKPLATELGIPHEFGWLRRVRDTRQQALLEPEERPENVRNAFAFKGPPLEGKRILLIDDVLTTGFTASACANELMKNGAGEVRVWTLARGGLD
jgi:competence protein ComFC